MSFTVSMPGMCPYCSVPLAPVLHLGPCPRVKAIEYHPNGTVKRVEFTEAPAQAPITKVTCN